MTHGFHHIHFVSALALACLLGAQPSAAATDDRDDSFILEVDSAGEAAPAPTDSLPPIDSMPQIAEFVKAEYPDSLIARGVQGVVVLDLVVSDSGRVDSVAVVKGLHPALDSAATRAAEKFRFTPARSGGQPIAVLMQYPYRFSLDEVEEKIEQYVNFSGIIVEMGTRTPLSDATVVITPVQSDEGIVDSAETSPLDAHLRRIGAFAGQSYEAGALVTSSDSMGHFSYKSLPPGPMDVRVVAPGCKDFTEIETIVKGEATEVTYRVERVSYSEYEIVVYGRTAKKEVSQRTISVSSIKRIPGLGGDPILAIQAMPGVARPSFGGGEIVVRGGGVNDNRYFVDGVEIPFVYHMNLGLLKSVYNSYALESLEFSPGGFGVRYGDVVGSVIELRGRPAKQDRRHGYADLSFSDISLAAEVPIGKKVSVLAAVRRSHLGNLIKWLGDDVLHMNLPFAGAPFYEDFLVRADVKPAPGHSVFATVLGVKDSMAMIFEDIRGGSSDVDENTDQLNYGKRFGLVVAGWDATLTERLKNSLRYGLVHGSGKMSAFGMFKLTLGGYYHTVRDQADLRLSDKLTLSAGLDLTIKPVHGTTTFVMDTIVKTTVNDVYGPYAGYASCEWRPTEKLTLIPGLRYDYYPELDYSGSWLPAFWDYRSTQNTTRFSGDPSLRISGRYRLSDRHTIKASLGNYNSAPRPNWDMGFGRDLARGEAIDKLVGDPTLRTTKASHYVLGYEWRMGDLLSLDAQGYINQQWNMTRMPGASEAIADANIKRLVDNGKGRMFGLEILLKRDEGARFYGWLSYTLARAERWDVDKKEWPLYEKDILNNAQLVAGMKLRRNMELGLRLRYTDGYPTAPLEQVEYYDATYLYYRARFGSELTDRLPAYVGVDVRWEKRFVFKRWMLTMYVEGLKLAHLLQFAKKKDGNPVYKPVEADAWYYDYSGREGFADFPFAQIGLRCDF